MPGAVVVALVAVLAAGAYTVAFSAGAFSDPGVIVRWGRPVVDVLGNLASALTLGALVTAAAFVGPGRLQRTALTTAGAAAAVWAFVGVVGLVLQYAVLSGMRLDAPGFGPGLAQYLTEVELGRTGLIVVGLAAATAAAALAVRGAVGAMWTSVLPLAALAYQASTGHAAGAAGHSLAVGAMFLHLVGAALWIGGLGAIAVLVLATRRAAAASPNVSDARKPTDLRASDSSWEVAVPRFSQVASWCLVAVGFSGVVSAWVRLGAPSDLVGTRYGWLVVAKAVLLAGLGALGLAHRRRVVGVLAGVGRAGARPAAGARTARAGARTAGSSARTAGSSARTARSVGTTTTAERAFVRLAAVEVLVMGAVSGVAVGLASSAPPVPDDAALDTSPAFQLTGWPAPPELTGARWFTEWRLDPLFAFACVAGIVVYLLWTVRLRRRGDRWPVGRTIAWCTGVVVVGWVTNGGPAVYGEVLFSAHMVGHMVLALLVPMLLVLGAPVTLLMRAVPPRKDGSRGPREWVLGFVHSRWGRLVAHPVVAAIVFVTGMLVFYYTPLFDWSLGNHVGHVWMVVHFTLAGYLFANALVGIDPGPNRPGYPQRLVLLFATMAFHAFFGVALMSQTTLLAADWFGNMGLPWGTSALADQQRGGNLMWGIGELPTLALAITVAVMWTRSDEREARRRDRHADRTGDAELEEYNAMLARMAERDGARNLE
ncbi:copper resistance D domain protein [Xylanimonas cellulosilytica DSM 15894]|uniref:Copper resistance D domain protein n=1 Tax=Xylanimonas cellulosilytica (strain DSM 15894 / JCM 12276 / CECT 5975 / KCTC 9989 / LMG 20990 / NBRC 107835 / XIL07) TaxID=446471 RepID=D1C0L7_XYLCX|nr:copper resistance D domain protein [Xylanimonas cellulosilytica DSM 15894]